MIKKKKKNVSKLFTCKKQFRSENQVFNIKDPLVKSFEDVDMFDEARIQQEVVTVSNPFSFESQIRGMTIDRLSPQTNP